MMHTLLSRIRALFSRRGLDARLDQEVQTHLDELTAEYERRGLPPDHARLAARRAFGGVEPMKEVHRDQRGLGIVTECLRDARFGLRLIVKERGFTAAAVVALALGIAANNTVFVLVNGLMLRDLPFADPDRIVTIGTSVGGADRPNAGVSHLDLQDWSAAQRTFDGLAAISETTMNVSDDGAPERFTGAFVSANAFSLIGHAPVIGRGFDARDDRPGAASVVVVSDALWRSRYKGDVAVIGKTIRVNGVPSTVIGVMPEGFAFPARSRLWQPLTHVSADTRGQRDARLLQGLGKLTTEATPARAAEDLGRIAAALATAYPATNRAVQPRIAPFRYATLGGRARTTFPILMMLVGFVLLMACANVANLLLARAAYRTREIAVRLALGASRMQIVRQLLVESVLLAGIAGLVGLGLSAMAIEVFQDAFEAGGGLPYWVNFTMDWRVFAFLALTCLGTGIVFGLVPALQASRSGISGRLVEGGTGQTGAMGQRRWATRLVVAQLALTPMLLAGAGLMMRSIIAQHDIDSGVRTAGLVRMRLSLSGPAYESPADRARFYRQLEDRLADASDVRATLASHAPFEGASVRRLSIDGRAVDESERRGLVRLMTVGRSYFDVMGTRPVRGSRLTASDESRRVTAAIVNEQFASVYFGNRDPIGHRLGLVQLNRDGRTEEAEIVGVAPNIRQSSTEAQEAIDPIVYVAYGANPVPLASILVRSNAAPGAVASVMGRHVRALDGDLPLYDVMTLDDSLALSDERIGLRVFGTIFVLVGGIALLLATLGLYSVTAYATAQRTREIGIRVALGSRPIQIGWLVADRAARQLALGLSIGMAGALAVNQLLRGVLIGIGSVDYATLVGTVLLLVGVTTVASAIPATRAMRLNPVSALRND
jgi:putative ABC transport system permease protein